MEEMNDRGQLLLVAGILLAVVFVALALLVNAAIYTDNVATRGGDSAGEALEYQASVVGAVGELLDAENANDAHENRTEIRDSIRDGSEDISRIYAQNHLRRGATTAIDTEGMTFEDGLLIRESSVEDFEEWSANASAVRQFVIELDTGNMTTNEPFRIDINGTEVEVNKTEDELIVRGGVEGIECTTDVAETVRFDVTGERFDGEPCRFGWPTLDDESQISLEDGTNGGGTYELTIRPSGQQTGLPGETIDTIYRVAVGLRIDTPDLRYGTTVHIAPGEPDA